jgi:hypothetical protein
MTGQDDRGSMGRYGDIPQTPCYFAARVPSMTSRYSVIGHTNHVLKIPSISLQRPITHTAYRTSLDLAQGL